MSRQVEVPNIVTVINTAKSNGLKKPAITVGDIKLSAAPDTGRNPGAVYVYYDGQYVGKISKNGVFYPGYDTNLPDCFYRDLQEINEEPMKQAQLHGRETGICSCCGAELTNAESIAYGIGPICRGKWGF